MSCAASPPTWPRLWQIPGRAELATVPEVAYGYAQAARHLAARIGVVREVSGITAYKTGRWAEALAELRAARRLTGRGEHLP